MRCNRDHELVWYWPLWIWVHPEGVECGPNDDELMVLRQVKPHTNRCECRIDDCFESVEPDYEAAIPYVRQACQRMMILQTSSYITGADVDRAEKDFNALVKQAVDAAYGHRKDRR